MVSPNLDELITTTLRDRSGELSDAFTNNTALFFRLNERGNKRLISGGRSLVREISYQENGTFGYYAGYDTLSIAASDVFTSAEFNWKQAAVAVSYSGYEKRVNSGEAQVLDLIEERITNAEGTMVNNLSDGLYSDGTGSGGKQIGGLQSLIADAGTGTVGGINSTTWTFWRNQKYDFSDNSLVAGPSTIQRAMNSLWLATLRNRDMIDLIVADNNYYTHYWESLQPQQRFTSTSLAEAGFDNLKYKSSDVVADGGIGGDAASNHMYFLNTRYLNIEVHKDADMVPTDERMSVNQDASVKFILWMGNMTCRNRRQQGVIVA